MLDLKPKTVAPCKCQNRGNMEDDQQFCLRWNNHQSTLVAVFDTLLENGTLVDCTLAAEGKYLNAHKVVLSACSPYFESLLSQNYDKHPIFILKDVKFQELKAMMDYMYRGEVNISQDQLGALLKAAESLQIKGLSDNKKDTETRKSAPPAPAKSPTPTASTNLPRVQGLTIEQRRGNRSMDEREGSLSPGPRKRKRMRRRSTDDLDNHHDASNSSESHSNPPIQNIPIALPPASSKLTNADVPEPVETKSEILSRHKISSNNDSEIPQVPIIKEKLETHTELMLEPKAEYVEEMNEDSIEDLTLDDDDVSNLDMSNDGAGPSHGNAGEGSSQGFGGWHMGNQSQDEVFLAAQEAVGAHRDSQVAVEDVPLIDQNFELQSVLFSDNQPTTVQVIFPDSTMIPPLVTEVDTLISLENLPEEKEVKKRKVQKLPCSEYLTTNGYSCPKCGKLYNARKNLVRHLNIECGKEPQKSVAHHSRPGTSASFVSSDLKSKVNLIGADEGIEQKMYNANAQISGQLAKCLILLKANNEKLRNIEQKLNNTETIKNGLDKDNDNKELLMVNKEKVYLPSNKCTNEVIWNEMRKLKKNLAGLQLKFDDFGRNQNETKELLSEFLKQTTLTTSLPATKATSTFNIQPTTSSAPCGPASNIDECMQLEERLSSIEYRQHWFGFLKKYTDHLKNSVGHRSANEIGDNCVFIMLDFFFTRELMTQCSWTGQTRSDEKKIPFKDLKKVLSLMLDVINELVEYSFGQLKNHISIQLRNSKSRVKEGGIIRQPATKRKKNIFPLASANSDAIDKEAVAGTEKSNNDADVPE
ncbi:hypothetical protein RN001_009534 [Aquatica leii]|uniref:Longitudinals lacking protein n=1 Tax=Aquatica leii TaxID=1421715 RepID=A0AAN7P6S5_9COLE|nr:hypothetical protein RN001_009534 [Aquatica leii]